MSAPPRVIGPSYDPPRGQKGTSAQHHVEDHRADVTADDNKRVLQRIEAAIADTSGRLRLLIDGTHCSSIPGFELAELRRTLRELDCSNSPYLTHLPMEIGHLHNTLRQLDCSSCALTSLPDEISLLHQLEVLNCSKNQLETFVWNCDALKQLKTVDLSHNRIRFLSPSAAQRLLSSSSKVKLSLEGNDATLRQTAKDSEDEQRSLLPVSIDRCVVCDEVQAKLPPRVFIQFIKWRQLPTAPLQLVPILYPCCGAECAKALQQWQTNPGAQW